MAKITTVLDENQKEANCSNELLKNLSRKLKMKIK